MRIRYIWLCALGLRRQGWCQELIRKAEPFAFTRAKLDHLGIDQKLTEIP